MSETEILPTPEASEPSGASEPAAKPDHLSDRTFADFPISPELLAGIEATGYTRATPIQARGIEPALAGKDLVLRARTGTGKTAAYSIPMLEMIEAGSRRVGGLILTPTRELAVQVAQVYGAIGRFKDVRVVAIYGGTALGPQEQALREGVEIVVGTPGRVLDHIKRGNLKLDGVRQVVLDEADEMLSMGFLEDVRRILDRTPEGRQVILCSATFDESMKGLAARYLRDPEEILLSYDGDNVKSIAHILYETSPDYHKARALLDLIEQERPSSALIFCNTREDVTTVYNYLERQGMDVEMLSGELSQSRRDHVMALVKAGAVQFLVATDVAARGIDISDLSHVINYALPDDPAVYLHRIGRTGRIGKSGTALTLAGGADFSSRLSLERIHRIQFEVRALPTAEESAKLRTERLARSLKDAMNTMVYEGYLDVVRAMKDRPDGDAILAAALRAFVLWNRSRRTAAVDAKEGEAPAADAPRREERREERRDDRRSDDRGRRDERRDGRRSDERRSDDRRSDDRRSDERRDERRSEARPERTERAERPERTERTERPERPERPERTERTERPERTERAERTERPERTERAERTERPERRDRKKTKRAPREERDAARPDGAPSAEGTDAEATDVVVGEGGVGEAISEGAADRAPKSEGIESDAPTEEVTPSGEEPTRDATRRRRRRRRRSDSRTSEGSADTAEATDGAESGASDGGAPDGGESSAESD